MKTTAVVFASVATISGAATADAVPSASGADGSGILKPAPAATAGSSPADPALDPAGALFLGSSDGTPGLTSAVSNVGGASDVVLGGGAASLDVGGGLSAKDDDSTGGEEEMAKEQNEDEDVMVEEEEEAEEEEMMTTKEEDVEPAAGTVSGADVGTDLTPTDTTEAKQQADVKDELQVQDESFWAQHCPADPEYTYMYDDFHRLVVSPSVHDDSPAEVSMTATIKKALRSFGEGVLLVTMCAIVLPLGFGIMAKNAISEWHHDRTNSSVLANATAGTTTTNFTNFTDQVCPAPTNENPFQLVPEDSTCSAVSTPGTDVNVTGSNDAIFFGMFKANATYLELATVMGIIVFIWPLAVAAQAIDGIHKMLKNYVHGGVIADDANDTAMVVNGTNSTLGTMTVDADGNVTSVVGNSSVVANSTDGAATDFTNSTNFINSTELNVDLGNLDQFFLKGDEVNPFQQLVTANYTNVTPAANANSSVLANCVFGTATANNNSTELKANPFQPIRKNNNTNGTAVDSTERKLVKGNNGANEVVGIETNESKMKGTSGPDVNLKTIVGTTQTLINSTESEVVVSKLFQLSGNDGTRNEPSTPTGSTIKKLEAALPAFGSTFLANITGETMTQCGHEGLDSMYNIASGLMHHGRSTGHAIADTFDTFKADHPELVDGCVAAAVLSMSCLVFLAGYFSILRFFM